MDIFDHSLMRDVIEALKFGTGSEIRIRRSNRFALCGRPNIINDLVQIFTRAGQPVEVQECVTTILEKASKGHASVLLSSEHCLCLLRVAREKSEINHKRFAAKLLAYSLSNEQSCEDIVDENALGRHRTLDEMARDEQHHWVTDGTFAMYTTILNQNALSQKLFAANTLSIVCK